MDRSQIQRLEQQRHYSLKKVVTQIRPVSCSSPRQPAEGKSELQIANGKVIRIADDGHEVTLSPEHGGRGALVRSALENPDANLDRSFQKDPSKVSPAFLGACQYFGSVRCNFGRKTQRVINSLQGHLKVIGQRIDLEGFCLHGNSLYSPEGLGGSGRLAAWLRVRNGAVVIDRLRRRPRVIDSTPCKYNPAPAELPDKFQFMAYKQHGAALSTCSHHPFYTLLLKRRVYQRQHLVHKKDLRLLVRGHSEGQTDAHAA